MLLRFFILIPFHPQLHQVKVRLHSCVSQLTIFTRSCRQENEPTDNDYHTFTQRILSEKRCLFIIGKIHLACHLSISIIFIFLPDIKY